MPTDAHGAQAKIVRFLFNDQMARAIVEGRKTVTRRPIVDAAGCYPPDHAAFYEYHWSVPAACFSVPSFKPGVHWSARMPCAPGDLLIGRESWRPVMESWRSFVEYRAGGELDVDGRALFVAERGIALRFPGAKKDVHTEKWHPSNHMPDWAARIRRRVLSVTVERVQDITEEDAVREGFPAGRHGGTSARNDFLCAWDDIYLNRGLASTVNPWVWRYEFGAENVEGEA